MSEKPSKEDVHPFQEMCETAAMECFYKDLASLSAVDQEMIREVASEVMLEELNEWVAGEIVSEKAAKSTEKESKRDE